MELNTYILLLTICSFAFLGLQALQNNGFIKVDFHNQIIIIDGKNTNINNY